MCREKGPTKLTPEAIEIFSRQMDRQWTLELLREKHRLSLFEVQGVKIEEIQRRVRAYRFDLDHLEHVWRTEDDARKNPEKANC